MPIYTFYPCRPDGSSTTFEAFELDGDDAACGRAALLLEQHPSCAFVTVWRGDREVLPAPSGLREELLSAQAELSPPTR
jgi:hypothetical protein